jgi:retron-type reverse transcriptase
MLMKAFRKIFSRVCAFENLYRAFRRARRGKRDREEVAAFEYDLEANLFGLQTELETGTYRPGPYCNFWVREPKRRKISAAPFRDRVVHHALCQVIEPIFERCFIHDSYACRLKKGTHRAVDRCQAFARRYRYVLKADIRKFFPSVDHAVLLDLLAKRLADPRVMELIRQILKSGEGVLADEYVMQWFPGDDLLARFRPRGLPIGNLTSQFWANVYLNSLDQFIKRRLNCRAYVRYVDDFLLFSDDKAQLHRWKEEIMAFLGGLRLALHVRKSVVFPVSEGIDFLGYRVFAARRRMRRTTVRRFTRRLRSLQEGHRGGRIPIQQVSQSIQSWVAHCRHAQTFRLRRAILSQMPF